MRCSSTSAATATSSDGGSKPRRVGCLANSTVGYCSTATGQQELTADSTLQKIQDRFTIKVVLKNQDVDAVVRRVLLSKDPAKKPGLDTTLASVAGQISRQLIGSKIQHTSR